MLIECMILKCILTAFYRPKESKKETITPKIQMMPKLISMVTFIMNSNEKGKYCQQLIMLLPSIIGMGAVVHS